jgi:Tol biopolymer transport system component
VSETGVLAYAGGGVLGQNQIVWYDRGGKFLETVGAPGVVFDPAISPDGKSIAYRRVLAQGDLWLRDLTRGTEQRLKIGSSANLAPFWSPSGDRVVFASYRGGNGNLYQEPTSGTGKDEQLLANGNSKHPTQWSRDGKFIVYSEADPKTRRDIWVLPMAGVRDRKPIPFLRSETNEFQGQLSPDSHWMAYTSDESGQPEVYVRPFPAGERQWPISIAGGEQPRCRGDGKELFFVGADGKMMAVAVKALAGAKPTFDLGTPQPLFDTHLARPPGNAPFNTTSPPTGSGSL